MHHCKFIVSLTKYYQSKSFKHFGTAWSVHFWVTTQKKETKVGIYFNKTTLFLKRNIKTVNESAEYGCCCTDDLNICLCGG